MLTELRLTALLRSLRKLSRTSSAVPLSLAPGAADAPRRSVEVDAYIRASLVAEARRIADAGGPHLNQHQVLRVMLMRAARCRCGMAQPTGTGAGAAS
jgi:hypothetical protein